MPPSAVFSALNKDSGLAAASAAEICDHSDVLIRRIEHQPAPVGWSSACRRFRRSVPSSPLGPKGCQPFRLEPLNTTSGTKVRGAAMPDKVKSNRAPAAVPPNQYASSCSHFASPVRHHNHGVSSDEPVLLVAKTIRCGADVSANQKGSADSVFCTIAYKSIIDAESTPAWMGLSMNLLARLWLGVTGVPAAGSRAHGHSLGRFTRDRQASLRKGYGRLLQTCPSRRSLPAHASDPTRWSLRSAPGAWARSIVPAIRG